MNYEGFGNNVKGTVAGLDDAVSNNLSQQVGVAQGFGVAVSDALYQAMFVRQQADGLIPAAPTWHGRADIQPALRADHRQGPDGSDHEQQQLLGCEDAGRAFPGLAAGRRQRTALRAPCRHLGHAARRRRTTSLASAAWAHRLPCSLTRATARTRPRCPSPPAATPATCAAPLSTDNEVDTAFVASGQINLCDKKQGNLRVLAAPGTGDVRNELNKATILGGATNYAIGVVSLENDQATYRNTANVSVPTTWKWLRVQGTPGADNAAPGANTNRASMIAGNYDFFYETWSYTQSDGGNNDSLISAVIGTLTAGPALDGLVVIGTGANREPVQPRRPHRHTVEPLIGPALVCDAAGPPASVCVQADPDRSHRHGGAPPSVPGPGD